MEDTGRAARYPHVTRKLTQCCHDLWNPPCQGHSKVSLRVAGIAQSTLGGCEDGTGSRTSFGVVPLLEKFGRPLGKDKRPDGELARLVRLDDQAHPLHSHDVPPDRNGAMFQVDIAPDHGGGLGDAQTGREHEGNEVGDVSPDGQIVVGEGGPEVTYLFDRHRPWRILGLGADHPGVSDRVAVDEVAPCRVAAQPREDGPGGSCHSSAVLGVLPLVAAIPIAARRVGRPAARAAPALVQTPSRGGCDGLGIGGRAPSHPS